MRTILICLMLLQLVNGTAQQAPAHKWKFFSDNQFGILYGQAGNAFSLQSVNGLTNKVWSAGLATGIDEYHLRSVPLLLSIKRNWLPNAASPFIFVQGGYHVPWPDQQDTWETITTKGGWMYEAGIGYSIPMKGAAFLLSAGYSYKAYNERILTPVFCIDGNCPPLESAFAYQLRRVAVRAGLRF